MTLYELLKFLHVAAAATWVGGGLMLRVLGSRALAADRARAVQLAGEAEQVGMKVLMPASILLLVSGLWTAFEGGYGLDPLWVKIGLAIYVASAVVGARFLGPLNREVVEHQDDAAALQSRLQRISTLGWVDLGLLLLAIFVMVVKPD